MAVEKANGNDELKEDLLACLNELMCRFPDTDEYRKRSGRSGICCMNWIKAISIALQYALNGLDMNSVSLRTAFGILEDINAYGSSGGNESNKWNDRIRMRTLLPVI